MHSREKLEFLLSCPFGGQGVHGIPGHEHRCGEASGQRAPNHFEEVRVTAWVGVSMRPGECSAVATKQAQKETRLGFEPGIWCALIENQSPRPTRHPSGFGFDDWKLSPFPVSGKDLIQVSKDRRMGVGSALPHAKTPRQQVSVWVLGWPLHCSSPQVKTEAMGFCHQAKGWAVEWS